MHAPAVGSPAGWTCVQVLSLLYA